MSGAGRWIAAALPLALLAGCDDASAPVSGSAGVSQDPAAVASCYAATGIGIEPAAPKHALFVIVDQTTSLDAPLRDRIAAIAARLVVPGTTVTVDRFSATDRDHHLTHDWSGTAEPVVPAGRRGDLPVRRLDDLDKCLPQQQAFARAQLNAALAKAITTGEASFANSEIVASLTQASQAVAAAPAADRVVLVVSDLLEHSTATSFYQARGLRRIDPKTELDKVAALNLLGDFGDARVYVVGAGQLAPEGSGAPRDAAALLALRTFWENWFRNSHATLAGYGQPELMTEPHWVDG